MNFYYWTYEWLVEVFIIQLDPHLSFLCGYNKSYHIDSLWLNLFIFFQLRMTDFFLHASFQGLECLRIAVVMGLASEPGLPLPDSFLLTCIALFNLIPRCRRTFSSNVLLYTALHCTALHLNNSVTQKTFPTFHFYENFLSWFLMHYHFRLT